MLLAEQRPVVLDDIWLPARLFKDLNAERLAAYEGPMYALFEAAFGVQMIRAEEKIRAVAADNESRRVARGSRRLTAAERGATLADLWRAPGRVAPRPVPHRCPSLSQ
mgnify:CR=1 FL=1